MKKGRKKEIDLSFRRRMYYRMASEAKICPECNSELIEEGCTILLVVKSTTDTGEFMTNMNGSHFCPTCPVVVFDKEKVEQAAALAFRGEKNIQYRIEGIVDLDAIPEEKKHLGIGTEENPVPLVLFLPDYI